ncbi:uncharacterized protein CG43867 isoform X2 [Folsomia candida]|uniref:uncharacterized protein CG43867 isoform X2 n=1 Tax=Folsomia candida TaxID=158441 RepID=UPI001605130C|nr:uncharacterized protein CG43867 isoform X2 [Folsomia candida]
MVQPRPTVMANVETTPFTITELLQRLAELERRVVEAESRANEAEDKVRVMEQQLSDSSNAAAAWAMGEEQPDKLCNLQLALTVREKDRVISRLECQVEEIRLLRLQESRQVEEKAAKIKEWVSNKLRDLEEQNECLREQNQKCENQLELLKSRLTQLSTLELKSLSKSKDRHSTEDSSRGSYEGDRPGSDESPPHDTSEHNGHHVSSSQTAISRSAISATAACIAAIKRRSAAFDSPEERERRRKSNLSNSGSTSGGGGVHNGSLRDPDRRDSRGSRGSRVDSGSVDMETPQSLSPRSPLDSLEPLDGSLPSMSNGGGVVIGPSSSSSALSEVQAYTGSGGGGSSQPASAQSLHHHPHNLRHPTSSSSLSSHPSHPLVNGHGVPSGLPHPCLPSHSSHNNNNNNNNNHVIISSPSAYPVPPPIPVLHPQPITISHSPLPATPNDVMIGGSESTGSLISDRRAPIVPPRRCRTRSPTPNTSHGTTPGTCSPPTTEEEDATVLRARLDAECQQLARDLQAAVRELVRPELSLGGARASNLGGSSSKVNGGSSSTRGKAMDEVHDYSEIYTPSAETPENCLPLGQPPPPPIHRFPEWESRIYQVAAGGLKVPSNGKGDTGGVSGGGAGEISCGNGRILSYHSLGINFSVPVYTTVKGRASRIRDAPFSGDSSDSSDGEELGSGSGSGPSHPMSSGETDISSPGKISIANSLSPLHRSSSSSKSVRREPSFGESEISDDYAIPPDAFASETSSLDLALSSGCNLTATGVASIAPGTVSLGPSSGSSNPSGGIVNSVESSPRKESLEKAGYLTKLGGTLKTWRKRYFILKNGTLTYWKTQQEASRRPTGRDILLDDNCRINRGDGAATFEIVTVKKTYYLTADSTAGVDEWVKVLQNVVRRNATKLVLSMEDSKPTVQGWLTKVKNGHAKRCWCVLTGKMFLTFKSPSDTMGTGQVNMRDARVEDVDHVSDDSDKEESPTNATSDVFTVGIFPSHQSPIYLHFATKQEKDSWLYHLTIVSGKGPSVGTQFEQLVHKLMEVDGDPNSTLWKNPLLLHSKESISTPLTSLSSLERSEGERHQRKERTPHSALQNEAIKLFKSVQLFMSVPLDTSGIDYHVALAQNALQLCLDYNELQAELICALVKQTSKQMSYKNVTLHKIKHSRHFLLNATQSLFLCDSSSNHHGKLHAQQNQSNHQSSAPSSSSSPPSNPTNSLLTTSSHRANNHHGTIPNTAVGNNVSKAFNSSLGSNGRSGSLGTSSSSRSSPSKSSKVKASSSKGSSSSVPSSPLLSSHNHSMHHRALSSEGKSSVRSFVFIQGWQLLALSVSLFLPKNNKLLWYLKQHLTRNIDTRSECGKYAAYCQRSIERTLCNGPRLFKPSRMEVLSIFLKNPFHHSLPHSVPVHFLNGSYTVVGFDGSTTVEEFLHSLCHEIGCREPPLSGFALFEDDPFEKDLEHFLKSDEKVCDVISQWETALRERGSGKFETRRAVTLTFKSRIYRRAGVLQESDRERLLLCYQTNRHVVSGKFPLTRELSLELCALMAQIDGGDYKPDRGRGSGGSQLIVQILEKYYPIRYRDNLSQEEYKTLCDNLVEKWSFLKCKSSLDCVRIYLTCTRKWSFFGATLFSVNVRGTHVIEDGSSAWAGICEDGIAILDSITLQQIAKYSYASVITFGGAVDDHFMIVVDDCGKKRRLLLGGMSKFKVLEMTRLVADYINACCTFYGGSSANTLGGLTRHNSLKSSRFQGSTTLPPPTPRMERRHLGATPNPSPIPVQRCDSSNTFHRNQQPHT